VRFVSIGVAANGTLMSVLTIDATAATFVLVDLATLGPGLSCQTQWDEGEMLPGSPDHPAPPPFGGPSCCAEPTAARSVGWE
jgi:hypothetical protein